MTKTKELTNYLDEYIDEKIENKNLSPNTIKKKIYNIKTFIKWLEQTDIKEITNQNIKRILRKYRSHCLNNNHNQRSTVRTYMISIIDFFNYDELQLQIKHERLKISDIIDVKQENLTTARKRIKKISLTRKQTDFFLDTIRQEGNVRDYAIIKTFLDTGIRLKELMLLNKTDIQAPLNERGFYILPNDPKDIIEVHLPAKITKGQYLSRTTFITYNTLVAINAMIMARIMEFQKKKRQRNIIKVRTDRLIKEQNRAELFTTTMGTRFHLRGIQDIVKKYTKKCNERIEKEQINCPIDYHKSVSVHILRHTALSHYAEILTVAEVQSIAGHANSSTTDRYIHMNTEQIKDKLKEKMR